MTKFYVKPDNTYIGGFEGRPDKDGIETEHPDVPSDATEVPLAPDDARQIWDGAKWLPPPPAGPIPLDAEEVYDMLETKGVLVVGDRPRPKRMRA